MVEEPPRKKARANGAEAETAPAPRGAVNGGNVVLPMRPPEKPMPKMMAAGTLGLHGFCVLDLRENVHVPLEPKKKKDDEAEKAASSKAAEPARMRVVYPAEAQLPLLYPALPNNQYRYLFDNLLFFSRLQYLLKNLS